MRGLRPVEETIQHLLSKVAVTNRTEVRGLDAALGCCLAEDVVSGLDVPPADNSAMDGYAIRLPSVQENEWLEVSDRVPAGRVGHEIQPGTAVRIFTGAPIPAGADTVAMQENCEADGDRVRILELPEPGANVRDRGQDLQSGAVVANAGDRLTPQTLALIASVGCVEVTVFKPLRVAVMSTGDELVEPGGRLADGQIFNSNRYALSGLIRGLGMDVLDLGIVRDTPEATDQALRQAAGQAETIITTGGVSVGEEDHVKSAVERLGQLELWKLAIKPGKPLAFGDVLGKPFFGLPGNPVSTFVTFVILARPYLLAMQGVSQVRASCLHIPAGFSFKAGSRREYLRVRIDGTESGPPSLKKFANQGSGVMTSVAWADGLAEVEIGQQVEPGDILPVYLI